LRVGPFAHIGEVQDIERTVAALAGVSATSLIEVSGDDAVLSVALSTPTALSDELAQALPFGIAVTHAAPGELTVALAPAVGALVGGA
jgi:hypothetical protein